VKFECFEGFTIDGKPESTTEFEAECKKEGKFTGLETCNPKICGHPPSLLSALHSTIPDMVTYITQMVQKSLVWMASQSVAIPRVTSASS
jgi:hypothetical protein